MLACASFICESDVLCYVLKDHGLLPLHLSCRMTLMASIARLPSLVNDFAMFISDHYELLETPLLACFIQTK